MFDTKEQRDLVILIYDDNDRLVGLRTDELEKPVYEYRHEYYVNLVELCHPNTIHIYVDGELTVKDYISNMEPQNGVWIDVILTIDEPLDKDDLYEKALDKWGERPQVMMFMEESAELTKELSKYLRSISDDGISELDNEFKILSEMADVYIILEQLKYMFEFSDEMLEDEKQDKLKKLKTYLEDGE